MSRCNLCKKHVLGQKGTDCMACMAKCKIDKRFGSYFGNKPYGDGWKRCRECYMSVMTKDARCPCCNGQLKYKPRNFNQSRVERTYAL